MKLMNPDKPNAMSSLPTWLSYLEQIHPKTIELGLERVSQVAKILDISKPAPYVFTVAGTNGKGTTCKALEMILLAAGYKVGVYSSPHLLRYTERVRINNQELPDCAHANAFHEIEVNRGDISLTYFEYSTLSALLLFKQAQLDIVILEVGLGGRLDATNIVKQDMSIITSIALDHVDYLGSTRESIGREKAGIFKQNGIAIIGEPDMPNSINEVAQATNTQVHLVNDDWCYSQYEDTWSLKTAKQNYNDLPIANIPLANAATALTALTYSPFTLDQEVIVQGLLATQLIGRFQKIKDNPLVILDVAHNPHAAIYLQSQLQKLIAKQANFGKLRVVIGMLKDKDIASTLQQLHADTWYCATLYGERGASADLLASYLKPQDDVKTFSSVKYAWQQAELDASDNDIIVICGSFLTVADILGLVSDDN